MTKKATPVLENVYVSLLFLYHFVLWSFGLMVVLGTLSDFVPNLRGSTLAILLVFVPAGCISFGWCRYRFLNREVPKNHVYFIGVLLKVWLIWFYFLFGAVIVVSNVVPELKDGVAVFLLYSCMLVALCASIAWSYYRFRKEYLDLSEFPSRKFLEFFEVAITKRS